MPFFPVPVNNVVLELANRNSLRTQTIQTRNTRQRFVLQRKNDGARCPQVAAIGPSRQQTLLGKL